MNLTCPRCGEDVHILYDTPRSYWAYCTNVHLCAAEWDRWGNPIRQENWIARDDDHEGVIRNEE